MSTLIVKRSSEWNGKAREVGVYIDDEKVGTVKDGEILTISITPGTHSIKAKIDWCGSSSQEFTIAEDQEMQFDLSGFKYGNLLLPAMMGILILYYIGQYVFDVFLGFLVYIAGALFLYPLYHLTLGRDQYLILKKSASRKVT